MKLKFTFLVDFQTDLPIQEPDASKIEAVVRSEFEASARRFELDIPVAEVTLSCERIPE